jgi:hypothetical protein
MAIRVNGEGILISDYEEEGKRFEAARQTLGKTISPEESKTRVLDDLIGIELLNQAAKKNGYKASDPDINGFAAGIDRFEKQAAGIVAWAAHISVTSRQ